MRLTTIYETADQISPFALSEEYIKKYGMHDNSGVQIDCGEEIRKVLFSLDLSAGAVKKAKEIGANCIFTHHPAIFNPLYALKIDGMGKRVLACARAGISVLSAHLNLDCAPGGIDESLMRGLGGKTEAKIMHALTGGGYGRVYRVTEKSAGEFVKEIEKTFSTHKVLLYGNRPVSRVASFCGAGMDGESVAFAVQNGADTFVTSDQKHHLLQEAGEAGLNVVLLTHYAAEQYGFAKFYEKMKKSLSVECELFCDGEYL